MSQQRNSPLPDTVLKRCPTCGVELTFDDFMSNVEVEPIGMSIDPIDPELNYYYFNHQCAGCGTTFLVDVTAFRPLIREPIPNMIMTGEEGCEGHCTRIDDLALCSNECLYAPFRRFLLTMRQKLAATAPKDRRPV